MPCKIPITSRGMIKSMTAYYVNNTHMKIYKINFLEVFLSRVFRISQCALKVTP